MRLRYQSPFLVWLLRLRGQLAISGVGRTGVAPLWLSLDGEEEPHCFITPSEDQKRPFFCANQTHFIHRGKNFGCAGSTFSFNTIHSQMKEGDWRNEGGTDPSARLLFSSVSFLFDTGVDRPVHGHFISKLCQLYSVAAALDREKAGNQFVTYIIFFRSGFTPPWTCLSLAQRQLLELVIAAIERMQVDRWSRMQWRGQISGASDDEGTRLQNTLTKIRVVWAGANASTFCFPEAIHSSTGARTAITILKSATLGSGYENLFGSRQSANSFRRVVTASISPSVSKLSLTVRCPPPVALLLHRGQGSSSRRPIKDISLVRKALALAFERLYRNGSKYGKFDELRSFAQRPLEQRSLRYLSDDAIVEKTLHGTAPLEDQVETFRSFGLLLSPHSSALKNLIFAHPNSAVLEIQPGRNAMSNAFLIDIHHSDIHYEISDGHDAIDCNIQEFSQQKDESSSPLSSSYLGVSRDRRRNKYRAAIRVRKTWSQQQSKASEGHRARHPSQRGTHSELVVLGFFDSAEEAALKYDAAAAAAGKQTNFARSAPNGRWAWKCGVRVNVTALADAALKVLRKQEAVCPGMWMGAVKPGSLGASNR